MLYMYGGPFAQDGCLSGSQMATECISYILPLCSALMQTAAVFWVSIYISAYIYGLHRLACNQMLPITAHTLSPLSWSSLCICGPCMLV